MNPKRILAPVDFSDSSAGALREALFLARQHSAALTVMHVHSVVRAVFLEATLTETAEESMSHLREAESALQKLVDECAEGDEQIEIRATLGDPKTVIIEASANYDLIVMSSHGSTGLTELLLGSVTERVVRGAKCSILIVKPAGG